MKNRRDVTVSLPADWVDEIDDQLEYGDSRSAWIREAVRLRLAEDGCLPDSDEEELSATAD